MVDRRRSPINREYWDGKSVDHSRLKTKSRLAFTIVEENFDYLYAKIDELERRIKKLEPRPRGRPRKVNRDGV